MTSPLEQKLIDDRFGPRRTAEPKQPVRANGKVPVGITTPSTSTKPNPDWRGLFHTYDEALNAPPLQFRITGFLQEEGINIVGGLPGHGKTFVLLNIVKALLESTPLFGYLPFKVTERATRVVYLCPESALAPFAHRLALFNLLGAIRDQRLFVRTLNAPEIMASITDPRMLEAVAGADVFLDTAVRFLDGDENSASDMKQFSAKLFHLEQSGARSITVAYHSPKSLGRSAFLSQENTLRGSGEIAAACATAWGIYQSDPEANQIVIKNVKARDFTACSEFRVEGKPWLEKQGYFQITGLPGEHEEYNPQKERGKRGGRPATPQKTEKVAEAKRLIAAGATQAAAAAAVGVSKQLLFTWLRQEEQAVKKPN